MELSSSEDLMILLPIIPISWSHFGMIPACDRQSDGWTESIIANTALCIAMLTRCKKTYNTTYEDDVM